MKKRKAAVLGVGHVGAHAAYALVSQGIVDELVLIDKDEQKAISEAQDLSDALFLLPYHPEIYAGSYDDLKDADILIHAVGDIELLRKNQDRIDELIFNTKQAQETGLKIKDSGFDGILINISNPCDVITALLAEKTGLPKGHVFGTGTGLDTSRLVNEIHKATGVDHVSIQAYMIGEHGNVQFCPWSTVTFAGMPLEMAAQKEEKFRFNQDALKDAAIADAWKTFAGKFCTEYGIGSAAARMSRAVLKDEKLIIPASAPFAGEYGQKDVFAGIPVILGADGVESIVELPLNEEEQKQFAQCCDHIRENLARAHALEKQTN